MKRLLLVLAAVCALNAWAEEAVYEDIVYSLDLDKMTAEVGLNPRAYGEIVIPETIKVDQGDFRVTAVGDNAFKGAKDLTAIELPATIEHIYRSAFEGTGIYADKANWLDGVLMIDSMYLIAADKSIKPKYEMPGFVKLVAIGAFKGNKTVTKVTWSESVKVIDHEVFRDCKNLVKLVIPESVEWIGQDGFGTVYE